MCMEPAAAQARRFRPYVLQSQFPPAPARFPSGKSGRCTPRKMTLQDMLDRVSPGDGPGWGGRGKGVGRTASWMTPQMMSHSFPPASGAHAARHGPHPEARFCCPFFSWICGLVIACAAAWFSFRMAPGHVGAQRRPAGPGRVSHARHPASPPAPRLAGWLAARHAGLQWGPLSPPVKEISRAGACCARRAGAARRPRSIPPERASWRVADTSPSLACDPFSFRWRTGSALTCLCWRS